MTDVHQLTQPVQRLIGRQRGPSEPSPLSAGVRLRRRREAELGACARLLGLVQGETGYPASRPLSLRDWLADPSLLTSWVAEREGEILGHVSVGAVDQDPVSRMRWRESGRTPSELAGVSRLFVRSRARGQGIGGALLEMAAEEARARGLTPVAEMVSTARDGVRLFEQHGWRLVGRSTSGRRGAELTSYLYLLPDAVPAER